MPEQGARKARPRKKQPSLRANPNGAPDALAPGGSVELLGGGAPSSTSSSLGRLIVRAGIAAWSLVGAFILIAVVVLGLEKVAEVFPPIIFGGVIVLLLEPIVARLVNRGIRRGAAVALVYIALLAALVGAMFVAIPAMVNQGQQFAKQVPDLLQEGGSLASTTLRRLNQDELGLRIKKSITEYVNENAGSVTANVERFGRIGLRLANFLVTVVVGLILGIYGLLALPKMRASYARVVPDLRRDQIGPAGTQVREVFTGFLRARLIVSAVVGALAIFGLWATGMPFWLILGITVGVTNIIPMIGSFIGGVPVLLVALLTKPPAFMLVALIVLVVAHAVDGYVLTPLVYRETTRLHPIAVLLSVIVGGSLLGVWGIIAAVPIAGAIQVVLLELLRRRGALADADPAV